MVVAIFFIISIHSTAACNSAKPLLDFDYSTIDAEAISMQEPVEGNKMLNFIAAVESFKPITSIILVQQYFDLLNPSRWQETTSSTISTDLKNFQPKSRRIELIYELECFDIFWWPGRKLWNKVNHKMLTRDIRDHFSWWCWPKLCARDVEQCRGLGTIC